MSEGTFSFDTIAMKKVNEEDLSTMQSILDHAAYYHTTIVQYSPSGLADRCFHAEPPKVEGSRVFKRFLAVPDNALAPSPIAALDLFVGYPNYKTASVAMLVIRDEYQRKGVGTKLLTEAIPAFLAEFHPAVTTLAVSLTENNVPALRCLLKCKYERTNRWEKLDIKGRPIIALTYKKTFK